VGTYNRLRRLWQPSADTLEAIAAELGEHWRSSTSSPERPYWPTPVSWVKILALRSGAAPHAHHFTIGGKLIR
jgi:hypothetical protein